MPVSYVGRMNESLACGKNSAILPSTMTHGASHSPDHTRELHAALLEGAERLRLLEQELQSFLDEYFAAVSQDIETLFALETRRSEWLESAMPQAAKQQRATERTREEAHIRFAREAYRHAARKSHPDTLGGNSDTMQRVNRAKEEGDIASLIAIALGETAGEDQAAAQAALLEWKTKLDAATQALYESPAYALYLKAFEARLAGRDWLNDMTTMIRRQVEYQARVGAKEAVQRIADWRVA